MWIFLEVVLVQTLYLKLYFFVILFIPAISSTVHLFTKYVVNPTSEGGTLTHKTYCTRSITLYIMCRYGRFTALRVSAVIMLCRLAQLKVKLNNEARGWFCSECPLHDVNVGIGILCRCSPSGTRVVCVLHPRALYANNRSQVAIGGADRPFPLSFLECPLLWHDLFY